MHLIDPKMMMQQVPAPTNPIHRSIATLDQEMKTILERSGLTDEEKVRQYNQVLQRYLEYHDHLKTPLISNTNQTVPNTNQTVPKAIQEEVLHTVPKTLRRKAETILERINRHPNMNWNDRGEFVFNGEVVRGSNVVDLVNDIIRHRKSFQPHGWEEFARALRQSNVPQDLVGNRNRWDWMHRETATSDAFSTAEESSPPRRSRPKQKTPAKRRIKSEPRSVKKEIKNWDMYQ